MAIDPQIGFADLVRACRRLRADAATRARIAHALGISRAPAAPQQPVRPLLPEAPAPRRPAAILERPAAGVGAGPGSRDPGSDRATVVLRAEPLAAGDSDESGAHQNEDIAGTDRAWLAAGPVLERPAEAERMPPPRLPSLLEPRQTRAILAALLATDRADGPLDLDALIERLSRREPVRDLPRSLRRALHRGAQVLLDRGPAMRPFAGDLQLLAAQLRQVVGHERVRVAYFDGLPAEFVEPDGAILPERWQPPLPGTPVLAVSDFTIAEIRRGGRRATVAGWRRFARRVAEAGCPLFGLVPYPPARWPPRLASAIPLVTWDRGTTVSTVLRRRSIAAAGA